MAKRGQGKNHGTKKSRKDRAKTLPQPKDPDAVGAAGDLRTVDLHVRAFLKGQTDEATSALMAMGRDASFLLRKAAEGSDNEELKELARRLAAVPPQLDTNLVALREASVMAHVQSALERAPLAADAELSVGGGAVAFFDPARILDSLGGSGRPRRDPDRIQAGDVSWLGLGTGDVSRVHFSTKSPPEHQPTRRQRIRVSSGVVFVGPPEASDGVRLGTVRIDPFSTNIDKFLRNGGFVRLKPGTYALFSFWAPEDGLTVHVVPDPDPKEPVPTDPATLADVPLAVDPTAPI